MTYDVDWKEFTEHFDAVDEGFTSYRVIEPHGGRVQRSEGRRLYRG